MLLILNLIIAGAGLLVNSVAGTVIVPGNTPILSFFFSVIALTTILIFLRGQVKDPESQTMYSLVSIGLKFLLELVLALIWFIVAKKTSITSVLIFFVIYLTLSMFSLSIILKTLKDKSL